MVYVREMRAQERWQHWSQAPLWLRIWSQGFTQATRWEVWEDPLPESSEGFAIARRNGYSVGGGYYSFSGSTYMAVEYWLVNKGECGPMSHPKKSRRLCEGRPSRETKIWMMEQLYLANAILEEEAEHDH